MGSALELSGDLREVSFASAAGMIIRRQVTGVLEIHDAIGSSRAFFVRGNPQGARLSRLKNPIGRILVDEKIIEESVLNEALAVHNRTDKLLGQVLLEMHAIDDAGLKRVMEIQSRLNFLSLFGVREGRFEFQEGLVHLTDFVPAPMAPLLTLYEGVRDYARDDTTQPLLAQLAFASLTLSAGAESLTVHLPPAEQMLARLLRVPRFTGDLARSVPLAPKALAAFLFALHELGALDVGLALRVHRDPG